MVDCALSKLPLPDARIATSPSNTSGFAPSLTQGNRSSASGRFSGARPCFPTCWVCDGHDSQGDKTGERVQFAIPPAVTRGTVSITVRKPSEVIRRQCALRPTVDSPRPSAGSAPGVREGSAVDPAGTSSPQEAPSSAMPANDRGRLHEHKSASPIEQPRQYGQADSRHGIDRPRLHATLYVVYCANWRRKKRFSTWTDSSDRNNSTSHRKASSISRPTI